MNPPPAATFAIAWAQALTERLLPLRDPERAQGQEAYMRNKFRFMGIRNPVLRTEVKALLSERPIRLTDELYAVAEQLFTYAEREYHQAACMVLVLKPKLYDERLPDVAARLITTQSWWDTVDTLAIHVAGIYLMDNPEARDILDEWIESPDFWLQRTAVIAQIGWKRKQSADIPRLFGYCEKLADSKEFFLQKAMGWALRELAKRQPAIVYDFVDSTPLPALTRREACKHRAKD